MTDPKLSNREQRLLTLLPAALVLVVYSFLIALPKQRAVQSTRLKLEAARKSAVDKSTAKQSEVNLKLASAGLSRLKSRLARDQNSIKERSQNWRNQESRLETVEDLTDMMVQYNLVVISQGYQDEPTVSEYMLNLFREMDAGSPNSPPVEYWQIELHGGYNEIQAFLTAVNQEDVQALPITLDMTSSESGDGIHTWTLIFVV